MTARNISADEAGTLAGLFRKRLELMPTATAYHHFDTASSSWQTTSWEQMASEIGRWQAAMQREGAYAGDRVAVMMRNCREWVVFDQAALGLGLVTVPLYTDDRPDNVAYVLRDSGARLLFIEGKQQWRKLKEVADQLGDVKRIVSMQPIDEDEATDYRLQSLSEWLFGINGDLLAKERGSESLASIVYTSGTTGKPKGVMLSHKNMLANAWAGSQCAGITGDDLLLSFLPLSHTLERTIGYYLPIVTGAQVAFARSVAQLAEDLKAVKPSIMVSVPRIYERVHAKIQTSLEEKPLAARVLFNLTLKIGYRRFLRQQGRASWSPAFLLWPLLAGKVAKPVLEQLGGRMKLAVVGGAPLSPDIARVFLALGLPLIHGYGLTESSPVISVNRVSNNIPESIGPPLPEVNVRIGENDELQTLSDAVMQGYWNNEEATNAAFTADGWLKTGDKARFDEENRLYITGRIKDIIVLGNGEKVPPEDMQMAIALDPLFEQTLVIGEGRPFLSAVLVLNEVEWIKLAAELKVDSKDPTSLSSKQVVKAVQNRVNQQIKAFPGYAQIRALFLTLNPWTVEEGLMTPTLKLKRPKVIEHHAADIEAMYGIYKS